MKRAVALLLFLLMLVMAVPVFAGDVTVFDATSTSGVMDTNYAAFTCQNASGEIILSIWNASDELIYQKNHGEWEGFFRSDDIYLPLDGSQTTYAVTLQTGNGDFQWKVTRKMPRLNAQTACAAGMPLSTINGQHTYQQAVVIDLAASSGNTLTMPLVANGVYQVGTVYLKVSDKSVTVTADISEGIDGTIDGGKVYAASTALEAQNLGTKQFGGKSGGLGKTITLTDAEYAVVYVNLTVSFIPEGVPEAPASAQPGQETLWETIRTTTINEAIG